MRCSVIENRNCTKGFAGCGNAYLLIRLLRFVGDRKRVVAVVIKMSLDLELKIAEMSLIYGNLEYRSVRIMCEDVGMIGV